MYGDIELDEYAKDEEEIKEQISRMRMRRDYLADLAYDALRDRAFEEELQNGRGSP